MARARNIKPGFYKNEELAECSFAARLIFPGLWMLADREGRLEDRHKRIKGELLPYDEQAVEPLLAELQVRGFIIRYAVGDRRLIQVVNFEKHQNPHHREGPSELPPPPSLGLAPDGNYTKPQALSASKGPDASGQPKARPNLTPHKDDLARGQNPADSGFRIPDSGFLIPESRVESTAAPSVQPTLRKKVKPTKGARLPDGWEPSDADRAFCAKARPELDVHLTADKFRDHWSSQSGKDGVKADWSAAWRNWVRNERCQPGAPVPATSAKATVLPPPLVLSPEQMAANKQRAGELAAQTRAAVAQKRMEKGVATRQSMHPDLQRSEGAHP